VGEKVDAVSKYLFIHTHRAEFDIVDLCRARCRRLARQKLNELWLGDITHVPTGAGWLYMSSVLDACSHRLPAGHWPDTCAPSSSPTPSKQPSGNAAADFASAVWCSTAITAAQ